MEVVKEEVELLKGKNEQFFERAIDLYQHLAIKLGEYGFKLKSQGSVGVALRKEVVDFQALVRPRG